MEPAMTSMAAPAFGRWNATAAGLERWVTHDVLALLARVAMASVFFLSGRTKVDGVLTVTDSALDLFREEYRLPLVSPELAAHLAAFAEHLFPLLLIIGFTTRLSAASLLGMTLVIEIFVYPDAWSTHLTWAISLLYLIGRGAGAWSLDRRLGIA